MMNCDKCNKPVRRANDAVTVEAEALGYTLGYAFMLPRHFLPEDGCEGSPSRAQYIEGQPRDSRYPYDPSLELPIRQAYEALQVQEAAKK